eukprot:9845391-Karenia_brevis.AAC.1
MGNIKTAVAAEVDARINSDPDYSRPPDPTVLSLNTQQDVELEAIIDACKEWLRPTFADNQWTVS